ncbi:MAG: hypothetical protein PF508_14760 [Spirochaeta sp.]|jgi:DNA polymerase III gamma/tau subunit|nr:hypothetical protein [Spirochaeta sp.]
MNNESQKAQAFVTRLLQNPALHGFSMLQQEEQIIQFLHANAAQLAPTLSSNQFFPGKNWSQIFSLLIDNLYEVINAKLLPEVRQLATEKIDYTFIQLIQQHHAESGQVGQQVYALVEKLLAKPEVRRAYTGAYTILKSGIVDRYLDEIFLRKTYIHFEMTKVQRLRMGRDEIKNFVDLNLLLKPEVFYVSSGARSQQDRATGMVQNQFAEKVAEALKRELKLLPEPVLKSIVHASVSFNDNRFIEATARLTAIFAARGQAYHPNVKVDRGADSPDKSWLSTARRNYKFYGFDVKMLDELYKIAAENIW